MPHRIPPKAAGKTGPCKQLTSIASQSLPLAFAASVLTRDVRGDGGEVYAVLSQQISHLETNQRSPVIRVKVTQGDAVRTSPCDVHTDRDRRLIIGL